MCILANMLQTPLAVLRRASRFPRLTALAKELGTRTTRISAIEAGRAETSDDFLGALAKALGFRRDQVVAAYLEGRRAFLRREQRSIEERLVVVRSEMGRRSA